MPELAEVEYFRRRWDDGIGQRVVRVELHGEKRVFRGSDPDLIQKTLRGAKLRDSETRGKQIVFRFSKGAWLGIHLGMSGKLRVETANFSPRKHDHLVLVQKPRTLVFSDPRMFGRVRFHVGKDAGLVGEPATGGDLARVYRGTATPHSAAPPAHPAEGAPVDAGVLSRCRKLDGRRNPLAGRLASARLRGPAR
jgi:Formamidopyrimidine-DNA glycosylase N-terminal domain